MIPFDRATAQAPPTGTTLLIVFYFRRSPRQSSRITWDHRNIRTLTSETNRLTGTARSITSLGLRRREIPGLIDTHPGCTHNGAFLPTRIRWEVEKRRRHCECLRKGAWLFSPICRPIRVSWARCQQPAALGAVNEIGSHRPLVWKRLEKWTRQVHRN